ncbi:MAG: secretion system protein [Chloroflexi bacterium]|nr:MAG: secretion system protein [Chloroflexota bacterium]
MMDFLWIVVAVGVIGFGVMVSGLILSRRSSRLIEERLGIADTAEQAEIGIRPRKSPLGDALNRALTERGIGANLATQLARADLKITVGEFIAATVILVIALGGVVYFLKKDILLTIGACVLGLVLPRMYVNILRGRRLKAFNNQLSDTINLMVNGIRAGYSVMQAMEAVSEEMGPPVSEEFGRVVREVQLGLTLEHAMNNMLRRVPSDDLDMMITAINVQREVGGNLAEVLDSISYTIRERVRIKGEIRAMTGQSRISGYMVALVPIALAVFIYLINPDFMGLLFTHVCGYIMIAAAVIGIVAGFAVIGKIVDIDV